MGLTQADPVQNCSSAALSKLVYLLFQSRKPPSAVLTSHIKPVTRSCTQLSILESETETRVNLDFELSGEMPAGVEAYTPPQDVRKKSTSNTNINWCKVRVILLSKEFIVCLQFGSYQRIASWYRLISTRLSNQSLLIAHRVHLLQVIFEQHHIQMASETPHPSYPSMPIILS